MKPPKSKTKKLATGKFPAFFGKTKKKSESDLQPAGAGKKLSGRARKRLEKMPL